ncbi:hypothetical protein [Pseudosporangium ferrugineum]|uniref:Uncharacterized protein n=1 Tax=Pseudosporangium ferrugineum TaxID=439699 RepID=A0A2T0RIQ2_9ACTN|nr:hypothetical protein [Pseudosporangium ferrugineum]PRY21028.1 hypothetical protein CLV70_12129 [Pseudosporangium ferrugineum]
MALELIAIATAAASAGVAEVTRRLLGRRKPAEPTAEPAVRPSGVSFGDVRAGGDVTQSGRDVIHHHGRRE